MATLKENFDFYLANRLDLVARYNGKYIVIKDCVVIGVFDSQGEAVRATHVEHELGTFLVQLVSTSEQRQIFHSRVSFVV